MSDVCDVFRSNSLFIEKTFQTNVTVEFYSNTKYVKFDNVAFLAKNYFLPFCLVKQSKENDKKTIQTFVEFCLLFFNTLIFSKKLKTIEVLEIIKNCFLVEINQKFDSDYETLNGYPEFIDKINFQNFIEVYRGFDFIFETYKIFNKIEYWSYV